MGKKSKKAQSMKNEDIVVLEDGECSNSSHSSVGDFVVDNKKDEDVMIVVEEIEDSNSAEDEESAPSKKEPTSAWKNRLLKGLLTTDSQTQPEVEEKKSSRPKMLCWNCDGEHNMNKCPMPKNFAKIRENREAHTNAFRRNDTRYHDTSKETVQFKPGRLSASLQRALGIGPNDIPEYIYRMRRMGFVDGYPPGYLKKAITNSPDDVLVFHTDCEESSWTSGEERAPPPPPSLNPDNVIFYFGFNKTYRALRDREGNFRIPPFDEFVSIQEKRMHEMHKRKARRMEDEVQKKKQRTNEEEHSLPPAPIPPILTPHEREKERKVSLGTPVLSKKHKGSVPSLESFSQGITPFVVDEPTPSKGFFNSILAKIRSKMS